MEQVGIQLDMPHLRPLGNKLYELRSRGPRLEHRVIYCAIVGQRFLLLHALAKKTQKTPPKDLKLAQQRLADWQARP